MNRAGRRKALSSAHAESIGTSTIPNSRSLQTLRLDSDHSFMVSDLPHDCHGFSICNIHALSQGSMPYELKTVAAHIAHPFFPRPTFPLSSDHLIDLIHYNVWRACLSNIISLGLQQLLAKDCEMVTSIVPTHLVPSNMLPTYLQQSVLHSSWIDMFPDPKLRDNMILAQGSYDELILFNDLVGNVCYATHTSSSTTYHTVGSITKDEAERNGLVVWSQPWDVNSWEITPGFLKRWAQLLEGCEELIISSNRWRAQRDERPLENLRR